MDDTITDSEEEAKKNEVKIKQFTELDRLAFVVRAIEIECACVPNQSIKMNQKHLIVYNQFFKGNKYTDTLKRDNWMHFRQPLSLEK